LFFLLMIVPTKKAGGGVPGLRSAKSAQKIKKAVDIADAHGL